MSCKKDCGCKKETLEKELEETRLKLEEAKKALALKDEMMSNKGVKPCAEATFTPKII